MSAMLPVEAILPGICASLEANRSVVLQAPPGSGKTTLVAPALLECPWLRGQRVLLLEPRRLAVRSAAFFMAGQRGERVGQSVGYHIRLERRVGVETRLEIVTEGILTRRLISDPEMRMCGAIIFDEFHERNLAADTALAMALEVRRSLRPDLRLLVMSATMRPAPIAAYLGDADIHTASATLFPVETHLLARMARASIPLEVAAAVKRALATHEGDILAFLPGEGEIKRTHEVLLSESLPERVDIHPLFAALSIDQQTAAIAPSCAGRRKIVLATSIAETSLTIEGVRVVIDSGWRRTSRFSPRTGMSRLESVRVSREQADQRRGRAGRLSPGVCYRLWDIGTDHNLREHSAPEILEADLCGTVLVCAEWGAFAVNSLPWLTQPPLAAWRQAASLLQRLGAFSLPDREGDPPRITDKGRAMAHLPMHPRLANMVVEAAHAGCVQQACLLAAALVESAKSRRLRMTDVRLLLDYIHDRAQERFPQTVTALARQWGGAYPPDTRHPSTGCLLAWAYPDRVARRRGAPGTYLLRDGQGARLDSADPLARAEWLVVAELQDVAADAVIRLAAPITQSEVETLWGEEFESVEMIYWEKRNEVAQAVTRTALGAIVIKESPLDAPSPEHLFAALCQGVRLKGIAALPWSARTRQLRARIDFLGRVFPQQGWPDVSDNGLLDNLDSFLRIPCHGMVRWAQVERMDLSHALYQHLENSGFTRRELDTQAPTHVKVPSGSRVAVHYEEDEPYIAVRLQEMFGMRHSPLIAHNRVPLVVRLLSPAQRPVQVTRDLESFWRCGYAVVRKELRGRYPKHYWPEDPMRAVATRGVRPDKLR